MAEASGTKNGGAGGTDAQPARPVVRYRFTVSTSDNRRLTSAVAAVLLPPYLDGAQWSQAQVGPGEKATMSVKAPGREGEKISFVVEQRGPKGWEATGSASATVKDGSAQAVQEMPFLPPPEEAGGQHEIRFRACSNDGQELQSQSVQLRPAPPPAVEVKLGTAHFAHAQYTVGDVAGLSVQAHGADGQGVRFVVEKKEGENWEAVQELRAVVEHGVASASWAIAALAPPAGGKAEGGAKTEVGAKPMQLRFQAIADFASSVSEPVQVAPAPVVELTEAEWSNTHAEGGAAFDHGEDAVMRVKASGKADGRRVCFKVEQKEGESWKPFATVYGVVHQGLAQAPVRVWHPAQLKGSPVEGEERPPAPPAELRFEADLV